MKVSPVIPKPVEYNLRATEDELKVLLHLLGRSSGHDDECVRAAPGTCYNMFSALMEVLGTDVG